MKSLRHGGHDDHLVVLPDDLPSDSGRHCMANPSCPFAAGPLPSPNPAHGRVGQPCRMPGTAKPRPSGEAKAARRTGPRAISADCCLVEPGRATVAQPVAKAKDRLPARVPPSPSAASELGSAAEHGQGQGLRRGAMRCRSSPAAPRISP
jgi:hypothetical protein